MPKVSDYPIRGGDFLAHESGLLLVYKCPREDGLIEVGGLGRYYPDAEVEDDDPLLTPILHSLWYFRSYANNCKPYKQYRGVKDFGYGLGVPAEPGQTVADPSGAKWTIDAPTGGDFFLLSEAGELTAKTRTTQVHRRELESTFSLVKGVANTEWAHRIYRMYAHDGQLLYVGVSSDPYRRFRQHMRDKPWISRVARWEIDEAEFQDRAEAEAYEAALIRELGPVFNIRGQQ